MATITFDTLAYSNKLQKSGVPRAQAEARAEADAEAFQNMVNTQQLANKQDILLVRHDLEDVKHQLENKISETKIEILKWMLTAMIAQTALLVWIIAFLR